MTNYQSSPKIAPLLVALGNPGAQYTLTRHNLGTLVAFYAFKIHESAFEFYKKVNGQWKSCTFSLRPQSQLFKIKNKVTQGEVLLLLIPDFVNLSGENCKKIYDNNMSSELIVVVDHLDLEFGSISAKKLDSRAQGHNGMRSINQSFLHEPVSRILCGISRPAADIEIRDYVLENIPEEQLRQVPDIALKLYTELINFLPAGILI